MLRDERSDGAAECSVKITPASSWKIFQGSKGGEGIRKNVPASTSETSVAVTSEKSWFWIFDVLLYGSLLAEPRKPQVPALRGASRMLMAITMVLPRPAARFRTAAPSARSRFVHRLLALRGRDPQAHFDATNQRRQFATDVSELEQKPRHLVSTDTSEEGEASLALPTGTLGLLACKTVAFMLYMQAANRVDPDRTAEDVAEGNLNKGTAWRPLCANSHVVQGHQSCGPSTASFVGDHVALDKSWWDTHFTASWVGVAQEGRHYTLATSSFLHANALHFGCNFLGLLCTASAVEHHLRSGLFMLAVYGSSAVAACTCQVGLYKLMSSTREKDKVAPDEHHHIEEGREQQTQRNPCESTFSDDNVNVAVEESNDMLEVRCLGASGGVCGLLGFLAAQQPAKRVYWFGCVPMPLWVPVATLFVADGSLALWKHYGARACSRTTSAPNRPGVLVETRSTTTIGDEVW